MIILEIIAVVSTILCVILTTKQNILCWPLGIVSVLSLIGIYIIEGIYIQILLQLVFLTQCIIGWYNWGVKDNLVVTRVDTVQFLLDIELFIVLGIILGGVNIYLNNETILISSMVDGVAALLALLGNWYLTKKKIQAWGLFMTYNILISGLLISKDLYFIGFMNIVLCCISFNGYLKWKKDLKTV